MWHYLPLFPSTSENPCAGALTLLEVFNCKVVALVNVHRDGFSCHLFPTPISVSPSFQSKVSKQVFATSSYPLHTKISLLDPRRIEEWFCWIIVPLARIKTCFPSSGMIGLFVEYLETQKLPVR